MFSNVDIAKAIGNRHFNIDPYVTKNLQPASIDLRLGGEFLALRPHHLACIDPAVDQTEELYERCSTQDHYYIHPGSFIIGTTIERVSLDNTVVGRLEGKSSLGRLGLLIHSTAGFFDPGFEGQCTLEIANVSGTAIKLYVGMPIAQFALDWVNIPGKVYVGKYSGQTGPQPSQYYKNFLPGGTCEHLKEGPKEV